MSILSILSRVCLILICSSIALGTTFIPNNKNRLPTLSAKTIQNPIDAAYLLITSLEEGPLQNNLLIKTASAYAQSSFYVEAMSIADNLEGPKLTLCIEGICKALLKQDNLPLTRHTIRRIPSIKHQDIVFETLVLFLLELNNFRHVKELNASIDNPLIRERSLAAIATSLAEQKQSIESLELARLITDTTLRLHLVDTLIPVIINSDAGIQLLTQQLSQSIDAPEKQLILKHLIRHAISNHHLDNAMALFSDLQKNQTNDLLTVEFIKALVLQFDFNEADRLYNTITDSMAIESAKGALALGFVIAGQLNEMKQLLNTIDSDTIRTETIKDIILYLCSQGDIDDAFSLISNATSGASRLDCLSILGKALSTSNQPHHAQLRLNQLDGQELLSALHPYILDYATQVSFRTLYPLLKSFPDRDTLNSLLLELSEYYINLQSYDEAIKTIQMIESPLLQINGYFHIATTLPPSKNALIIETLNLASNPLKSVTDIKKRVLLTLNLITHYRKAGDPKGASQRLSQLETLIKAHPEHSWTSTHVSISQLYSELEKPFKSLRLLRTLPKLSKIEGLLLFSPSQYPRQLDHFLERRKLRRALAELVKNS